MDDDENKPGVTRFPLIHDLVFDPSRPLKPSGKRPRASQSPSKKTGPYPTGYDPHTVDLFKDILDPLEFTKENARDTQEPDVAQNAGNPTTRLDERLRAELIDELTIILKHLKDQPES
jgi:hypothetical protein